MRVKTIIDEDFVNYKEPSMFIGCISCGGKCAIDGDFDISVCQNDAWRNAEVIEVDDNALIDRYVANGISKSIVFGLLEPFEQFKELYDFINTLRNKRRINDTVVIYTGYEKDEIEEPVALLKDIGKNIIVKFGRFRLGDKPHFDPVLGVALASDNQYAEHIS